MNIAYGLAFVGAAVGSVYFFARAAPADVYALPKAAVYDKLIHASVSAGENGVFHQGAPSISGNGVDQVNWVGHASTCSMILTSQSNTSTKVTVTCGKPGDDTVTSFSTGQLRNRVIEAVDATITGRKYSADKAEEGLTAFNWPDDTLAHASAGQVVAQTQAQAMKTMANVARAEDAERHGCMVALAVSPGASQDDPDRIMAEHARENNAQHPGCEIYNQPTSTSASATQDSGKNPWAK